MFRYDFFQESFSCFSFPILISYIIKGLFELQHRNPHHTSPPHTWTNWRNHFSMVCKTSRVDHEVCQRWEISRVIIYVCLVYSILYYIGAVNKFFEWKKIYYYRFYDGDDDVGWRGVEDDTVCCSSWNFRGSLWQHEVDATGSIPDDFHPWFNAVSLF